MEGNKPDADSSGEDERTNFEKRQARRSPRARAFFDYLVNELGMTDATMEREAIIVPGSRSTNEDKTDTPPQ